MVDATDRIRIDDCREELAGLLLEEVSFFSASHSRSAHIDPHTSIMYYWTID